DAQILQVVFHNGYIYQYFNVPERVHTDLVSANSKGKYLNKHIAGRYRYKQV
ncbi:MAG: KTSC domain-containing protein, partial [Flavobacteriales bacterium]|nr:KTSC domain-containing protein [Flavobacteriales bacterium]